jgi:hypothetical protein
MAFGIIRGMQWIIRIATACMSAQMCHEAGLPKTSHGGQGQVMGAPMQQEMGAQKGALNSASPPVPKPIARKFLQALRAEYENRADGAVGEVLDSLPSHQSEVLASYEDQVRNSGNPSAEISNIYKSWGM